MALTVSSIVGSVSGFIAKDEYINLAPATKEAVKQLIEGLDGVDWKQPQDLVNIIETNVATVAAATGVAEADLKAYFEE
tara:strand:+ start:78 stop:314 length:237 start_codon:yes stop_codon:yes gene_type:complete